MAGRAGRERDGEDTRIGFSVMDLAKLPLSWCSSEKMLKCQVRYPGVEKVSGLESAVLRYDANHSHPLCVLNQPEIEKVYRRE